MIYYRKVANANVIERKVGRNTLMFLIVTNLAVYIMETFLLKVNFKFYQTLH